MSTTPDPTLDVVAIGHPLVDVLSHEDEEFLVRHGLVKHSMALIDATRAVELYAAMGPGIEVSGGSAANTAVGVASFGGAAGYVGRTCADQLGAVFAHDIRAAGVRFDSEPVEGGLPTGRCLVVVTPDGHRTMSTFLGAAAELEPDDVPADLITTARVTYLEGYLFDSDAAKAAFHHAAGLAHDAGRRVALTLSDGFCVDRHRTDFLALVEGHVDVLFANEAEICSLYEVADFDAALDHVRGHCEIAALTRSELGSVVVGDGTVHVIDPHPMDGPVVDTTGAGDLYAAGFLHGLTRGLELETCGRLGSLAAAEVIGHLGPRPQVDLADLGAPLLR